MNGCFWVHFRQVGCAASSRKPLISRIDRAFTSLLPERESKMSEDQKKIREFPSSASEERSDRTVDIRSPKTDSS